MSGPVLYYYNEAARQECGSVLRLKLTECQMYLVGKQYDSNGTNGTVLGVSPKETVAQVGETVASRCFAVGKSHPLKEQTEFPPPFRGLC